MSKYHGPRSRVVRRLGNLPSFFSKDSKRFNSLSTRSISQSKKISEFCVRLKEKQKLRYYYGINERQLVNYLKKAKKKKGSTGVELLILLEMRLDNIVYRLGMATTIPFARQLVVHGHILVNESLVNIPSFICRKFDIIGINKSSVSRSLIVKNLFLSEDRFLPSNLTFSMDKLQGRILNAASRSSLILLVNELLIIEYYSRKL